MHDREEQSVGQAIQKMLEVLAKRKSQVQSRADPVRFPIVDRVSRWLVVAGFLVFSAAVAAGMLGWRHSYARYFANIGILIAVIGLICSVFVLLAALPDIVRPTRFWRKEVSQLEADSVFVAELARNLPVHIKTLIQMLILTRDGHQGRQRFVLGPGVEISPFLALIVASTVLGADIGKLAQEYAPWAAHLVTGPAAWVGLSFLLMSFVFARFRTLDIAETYSTQIGLLTSALELASGHPTDTPAAPDVSAMLSVQAERALNELVHVDVLVDSSGSSAARKPEAEALP